MGWAEFGRIRNDYDDSFEKIDEKIIKLLHERKKQANGKRFFPPVELMEKWAEEYDMEVPQISWLMHSVNEGPHSFVHEGPGELLNVIPIMKKTLMGDFQYVLSHAMQHQSGSIITLEIEQCDKEMNIGMVRAHLLLDVLGNQEYVVNRHGSRGGGGHTQVQYLVTPRLPDDLSEISFTLIPYALPMEEPPKEVILDKEVLF